MQGAFLMPFLKERIKKKELMIRTKGAKVSSFFDRYIL